MTEPNVGVLMFVAYRHLENRVLKRLAAEGHRISLAQARVFMRIGPDGTRLTTLAEQAQVTKQTAGFLVDQLESAGYVRREPDPTDARARLVRISEYGELAVARAAEVVAEVEAEWTAHLGARDMASLRRVLAKLRQVTDPYA